MAKTHTEKRLNLIAVSGALSFCAAGCLTNLLRDGCYLLGGHATLTITALLVVVLAIYAGLMSPQWVIRGLLRMRHVAGRWLQRTTPDTALWLPDSRADFPTVILVTQGSIVLFALLTILAGFSASYWAGIYERVLDRFFFPASLIHVCDFLFLAILLGPAWFVGGVLLALLQRLALTLDEDRTHPRAEPLLPVCLAVGFGGGLCLWSLVGRAFPGSQIGLWLSQLPALLTVITLLAHTTLPKRKYARMFKAASANLETVSSSRAQAALVLWLVGGLAGAAWLMQRHLLALSGSDLAHWAWFHGLSCLALAGGFLLARPQGQLQQLGVGPGLALALFAWAGIMLVSLIVHDVAWQFDPAAAFTGSLLRGLLLVLWLIGNAGIGVALHFGKQMLARVVTSRSLSWALWLSHTGAGVCLGSILVPALLLATLGSLMTLTVLILLALLLGGIRAIYSTGSTVWQRRVLVFAGFAMVALSSVVVPWAGRDWLRHSQDDRVKIIETLGHGWLVKRAQSQTQLHVCPLTPGRESPVAEHTRQAARDQVLRWVAQQHLVANALIVFRDGAFDWPMIWGPSAEYAISIDLLLPATLDKGLNRWAQQSAWISKPLMNRGRTFDQLQPRALSKQYDFIWVELDANNTMSPCHQGFGFWRGWFDLLSENGVLLVHAEQSTQSHASAALAKISRACHANLAYWTLQSTTADSKDNPSITRIITVAQKGQDPIIAPHRWTEIAEPLLNPSQN